MSPLSENERRRVDWVVDWIYRMFQKYGGTVYDKVTGKHWDWGQALCRECYGTNWNNEINRLDVQTPSWKDIDRAKRWENGELPEWFGNEVKP